MDNKDFWEFVEVVLRDMRQYIDFDGVLSFETFDNGLGILNDDKEYYLTLSGHYFTLSSKFGNVKVPFWEIYDIYDYL